MFLFIQNNTMLDNFNVSQKNIEYKTKKLLIFSRKEHMISI